MIQPLVDVPKLALNVDQNSGVVGEVYTGELYKGSCIAEVPWQGARLSQQPISPSPPGSNSE